MNIFTEPYKPISHFFNFNGWGIFRNLHQNNKKNDEVSFFISIENVAKKGKYPMPPTWL